VTPSTDKQAIEELPAKSAAASAPDGQSEISKSEGPTSAPRKKHKMSWSRPLQYFPLVFFAVIIVVPTAWIFMASFKQKDEFYGDPWTPPRELFFQNYIDAFVDARMGEHFVTSVAITLVALVISMVVALPAAYAMARVEFPGKRILRVALMAGLFINVSYIVVPIFLMLVGWDRGLRAFMDEGFFLNNILVLAVIYASTSLPFTIYLLQDYFKSIPSDYEEASMLDGASQFRTMVQIMFPLAKPAIATAMLFNFLAFWNDYIIALTLLPGEDTSTVQVGLLNLMTAQKAAANYGRLYAGMVIVMVPVLIFYAIMQKRLIAGADAGGVKG